MKVFAIGASRNVGYYTALGLLKASENNNVVFFLRNLSVFDEDADIQPFIKSGHAKLVKGDALNEDDLKNAFAQATSDGIPIDVVIFSLGGPPSFSITKGFVVSPPNRFWCDTYRARIPPTRHATHLRHDQTSARGQTGHGEADPLFSGLERGLE